MSSRDIDCANRFLFVIWSKARCMEPQLLREISARFKVVSTREISWPRRHFTANLAAFYGWNGWFCWWNKARKCGRGPFLVIEVEDPSPRWVQGGDTSGHKLVLNENVQRLKYVLRAMTGYSNRVHASMTREETAHELAALGFIGRNGSIPFKAVEYRDNLVFSAEELEKMLASGALERIGMGARRACYRLPDGKRCLKCYRSDAEIAEGKHPEQFNSKPLAQSVVREIRRCRFDDKRNTCCQEYRYWLKLKKRLPRELFAAFPSEMSLVRLPTRGWAIIEELVINADGTPPKKFADEWWATAADQRGPLFTAFDSLAKSLERHAVRFYDPPNIVMQSLADGSFRLRITDLEPASRLLVPIDAIPAVARLKVHRRFARYLRNWGIEINAWADEPPR